MSDDRRCPTCGRRSEEAEAVFARRLELDTSGVGDVPTKNPILTPELRARIEKRYQQYLEAARPQLEALRASSRITAADLAIRIGPLRERP